LSGNEFTNLSLRNTPGLAPTSDESPFEVLVVLERKVRIASGIDQQRQRQLGRSTSAVAPTETGRAVVSGLQVKRQRS
jgi:hypothetical protein